MRNKVFLLGVFLISAFLLFYYLSQKQQQRHIEGIRAFESGELIYCDYLDPKPFDPDKWVLSSGYIFTKKDGSQVYADMECWDLSAHNPIRVKRLYFKGEDVYCENGKLIVNDSLWKYYSPDKIHYYFIDKKSGKTIDVRTCFVR